MPIHCNSGEPAAGTAPVFLSDEVYGEVLRSKVINCVDLLPVFVEEGRVKVFLGRRDQEPMRSWWVFGGAHAIRKAPTESLVLRMKAEMGIEFDPARFVFLDTASMPWPTREQAPQDAGCHMSSWFYVIELALEELDQITFNKEYSDTKAVDAEEILNGDYHEVLKHMVRKHLEQRDARFRAIAFHNQEAERVAALLTTQVGYLSERQISNAIEIAGIPVLAELALNMIRELPSDADVRADFRDTLLALYSERPSTPVAQKRLWDYGVTPPPSNLSPKDFYATIGAAENILG